MQRNIDRRVGKNPAGAATQVPGRAPGWQAPLDLRGDNGTSDREALAHFLSASEGIAVGAMPDT